MITLFTMGTSFCEKYDVPLDNVQLDVDRSEVTMYCKNKSDKNVVARTKVSVKRTTDQKTLCDTITRTHVYKY